MNGSTKKKLDENKVETEDWHQSIAETLIHSYKVLESMTQDNKVMVHYYNKQTQKGEPYISCPNFNDVSEAKEWVEQIHYPRSLQKAGFKAVDQDGNAWGYACKASDLSVLNGGHHATVHVKNSPLHLGSGYPGDEWWEESAIDKE